MGERYYEYKPVQHKWPYVELGEVCEFIRGLTYNKENESSIPTRNAVLRANNIDLDKNSLVLSDVKYLSECNDYANEKKVFENDILICTSSGSKAHLGKVALIPSGVDFYFGGFMGVLRHNDKVNPQYLYYYLTSAEYRNFISSLLSGANINNIRSKELLKFRIPLPPLTVQKEIVDEIDRYQCIIDGARQTVDNYKPTIKIEATWDSVKVGDIIKLSSGKALPSKERLAGNYYVYGGNGITGVHNEFFVENPTIVIGRVGEYCGAVHITSPNCWITDNALYVTNYYMEVNHEYLCFMLNQMNLHKYAKVGGQPSISQSSIYELDIPFPNLDVQKKITNSLKEEISIVEQNKRLIEIFQQKIADKIAELWGE